MLGAWLEDAEGVRLSWHNGGGDFISHMYIHMELGIVLLGARPRGCHLIRANLNRQISRMVASSCMSGGKEGDGRSLMTFLMAVRIIRLNQNKQRR
jgi:hypothetical protein